MFSKKSELEKTLDQALSTENWENEHTVDPFVFEMHIFPVFPAFGK